MIKWDLLEILAQIFWFEGSNKAQLQRDCDHNWELEFWGSTYETPLTFRDNGTYYEYRCTKCGKRKRCERKNNTKAS